MKIRRRERTALDSIADILPPAPARRPSRISLYQVLHPNRFLGMALHPRILRTIDIFLLCKPSESLFIFQSHFTAGLRKQCREYAHTALLSNFYRRRLPEAGPHCGCFGGCLENAGNNRHGEPPPCRGIQRRRQIPLHSYSVFLTWMGPICLIAAGPFCFDIETAEHIARYHHGWIGAAGDHNWGKGGRKRKVFSIIDLRGYGINS